MSLTNEERQLGTVPAIPRCRFSGDLFPLPPTPMSNNPSPALILELYRKRVLFEGPLTKASYYLIVQLFSDAPPRLPTHAVCKGEILASQYSPHGSREPKSCFWLIPCIPDGWFQYSEVHGWLRTLDPRTPLWVGEPEESIHAVAGPQVGGQTTVGQWLRSLRDL